ncbi:unnamed protein product [Orchesella dallaii]|uniref:Uncharacterized protein n=1 Tax=Orchesella dallaii TaxID=48710 RepID=A0ABP1QBC7_9HEXA
MTSTVSHKTYEVFYKRSREISNTDARHIFKESCPHLIGEVFTNKANNQLITVISEFGFDPLETRELQTKPVTEQEWATEFIRLCTNRHRPSICLNILVNLHQRELRNYQQIIIEKLTEVPHVQVREVENYSNDEKAVLLTSETNSGDSIDNRVTEMENRLGIFAFFGISFLLLAGGITLAVQAHNSHQPKDIPRVVSAVLTDFERKTSSNQYNSEINDSNPISPLTDLSTNHTSMPTTDDSQTNKINSAVQAKGLLEVAISNVPEQQGKATKQQIENAPQHNPKSDEDNHQRIYIRRPSEIGNKTTLLCDLDFKTELVIDAVDPFEWGNVHVDCSTRIHSLVIKGHLRPFDMLYIVNQTRNIKHLTIHGNDICTSFEGYLAFIDALPRIILGRLRTLELRGMTDKESGCKEVLTLIANKFRFSPKFKTLIFNDVVITKNKVELHRIVYILRYYVKQLLMKNIDFRISAFDLNFPVLNLTSFHLFAKNSSSDLASLSVKNLLSNQHIIKEFHSNIEIPEDNMKLTLNRLKRIGVTNLKLSIGLLNTRNQLSIRFVRGFLRLTHCEIQLVSNDRQDGTFILRDVDSLRSSLEEFRVAANFRFNVMGGHVRCRGFEKNTKDGITILTMDKCPKCVESGCSRR